MYKKIDFKSPMSRQDFSSYLPVNKLVNVKVDFEKNIKINFGKNDELDGFDQDRFNRKDFDKNGFERKRIDEYGCDRNKELACKKKLEQAIRENPNIYQYATLRLKHNVDLAIFFLEQGGSFSLISKHHHKKKKVLMVAVEKIPNSFQNVGKSLKDDDDSN